MRRTPSLLALAAALIVVGPTIRPLAAQAPSIMADLAKDIDGVNQKLIALAKAMPADKYSWSPGAGVRSVGEVFRHVASDNYLLPAMVGAAPPSATGIVAAEYKTVVAYEKRTATREQTVADLEASIAFMTSEMAKTTSANLGAEVNMFGQKATRQALWILTATHLHEHLGQAIAYARMNGVVPPWSK